MKNIYATTPYNIKNNGILTQIRSINQHLFVISTFKIWHEVGSYYYYSSSLKETNKKKRIGNNVTKNIVLRRKKKVKE